ncbi:AN1-type zinc finger protein [Coccidioides immitis H538.4]|uniref:AN1-type zinc finger protein n=1 Tax=Coccidioides immitis H538.4 TaxID=396776 RepID=A0A0J8S2A8_COCIT|nr:AN1-type zinc finger protein [Coccidioides immitis H538.4]
MGCRDHGSKFSSSSIPNCCRWRHRRSLDKYINVITLNIAVPRYLDPTVLSAPVRTPIPTAYSTKPAPNTSTASTKPIHRHAFTASSRPALSEFFFHSPPYQTLGTPLRPHNSREGPLPKRFDSNKLQPKKSFSVCCLLSPISSTTSSHPTS